MKKIQLIIAFWASLVFSSCETESYFYLHLENRTSSSIQVKGTDIIHGSEINENIAGGEEKQIISWSKRGVESQAWAPSNFFDETLVITNVAGDSLKKDILRQENWSTDVDDQGRSAVHNYYFEIDALDF